jgi:putative DNA primase/helicase
VIPYVLYYKRVRAGEHVYLTCVTYDGKLVETVVEVYMGVKNTRCPKGLFMNWINCKEDTPENKAKKEKANQERERRQKEAARKAAGILKSAVQSTHPYLAKKGFPTLKGNVWKDLLVVPMRIGQSLVGCQIIDKDGNKKFLTGQITKGAHCGFDAKGIDILVEGFGTALSIRRALKAAKTRYKLWVCFSAANIIEVSKGLKSGVVVADHDLAGITAAKKTGLKVWLSDTEGEDFNDYELRVGTENAGENLRSTILTVDS